MLSPDFVGLMVLLAYRVLRIPRLVPGGGGKVFKFELPAASKGHNCLDLAETSEAREVGTHVSRSGEETWLGCYFLLRSFGAAYSVFIIPTMTNFFLQQACFLFPFFA